MVGYRGNIYHHRITNCDYPADVLQYVTGNGEKDRSGCFVKKIEKSSSKIKHTIQLKSPNIPGVSVYHIFKMFIIFPANID